MQIPRCTESEPLEVEAGAQISVWKPVASTYAEFTQYKHRANETRLPC